MDKMVTIDSLEVRLDWLGTPKERIRPGLPTKTFRSRLFKRARCDGTLTHWPNGTTGHPRQEKPTGAAMDNIFSRALAAELAGQAQTEKDFSDLMKKKMRALEDRKGSPFGSTPRRSRVLLATATSAPPSRPVYANKAELAEVKAKLTTTTSCWSKSPRLGNPPAGRRVGLRQVLGDHLHRRGRRPSSASHTYSAARASRSSSLASSLPEWRRPRFLAMNEGSGSSGGYLVPDQLVSRIIGPAMPLPSVSPRATTFTAARPAPQPSPAWTPGVRPAARSSVV